MVYLVNYFLIRAWAPLFVGVSYLCLNRLGRDHVLHKVLYRGVQLLGLGALLLVGVSILRGVSVWSLLGVKLMDGGVVVSLVAGLIFLEYVNRRTEDPLFSVVSFFFMLHALGWVYEVPYSMRLDFFLIPRLEAFFYYPFLVHSQIVSLVALVYLAYSRGFRASPRLYVSSLVYVLYFVIMFFKADSRGEDWFPLISPLHLTPWIARIPGLLMLSSLYSRRVGGS